MPCIALIVLLVLLLPGGAATHATAAPRSASDGGWSWPAAAYRITAPFVAPAHAYGPGHRGIDLEPIGTTIVRAPSDGVIAFAGIVAGRAVVTIDHGSGLVTTLEPVIAALARGTHVRREEPVGELSSGGHAASGTLHLGVRLHGDYINPLLLLGHPPRAVLLPCCAPL